MKNEKNIFLTIILLFLILNTSCNTCEDYCISGRSKLVNNDCLGAIADYDKAIESDPNYIDAYADRAIAKRAIKDYSGALNDWNKFIELSPKDAVAYSSRGLLKIQLGKKDSGCVDLSKAVEFGDQSAAELVKEYCN